MDRGSARNWISICRAQMKRNFILVIVGIVALVVVVRDVPFIAHVARVERERQITRLERDAYVLAGQARELVDSNGNIGARDAVSLVEEFSANSEIDVVVTDKNGILVASSASADRVGEDFKNRPEIASALLGSFALGSRESATVSDELVYAAIPVFFRDSVAGVVRLSRPQTVINSEVNSQTRQLLLAAGVAVLIAIIAGVALAGVVSAPLRRLQEAAEDLAQGRNAMVKPEGPKELRALARQFNSMSNRVSQMLDQQKRFAGDAAHQLRTPLTALRLRLEQAQLNIRVDEAAAGSNLEAALRETDRLSMLTERMLQLARSEGQVLVTESFDVGLLCREIAEEWSALAGESLVRVVAETNEGLIVDGSKFALREIVANYLDNALNHAPPRSTVSIIAARRFGMVEVVVRDQGPGLDEAQRKMAFERFWRAQAEPSSDSAGLGLAIVAQLSRAASFAVELKEAPGGGLDSIVRVPIDGKSLDRSYESAERRSS